ncbi:hypothetical protein U9M48_037808 [Paspalum notatum var. saurae]|uniref:F-box domain-containing protein n=1 Tax=Paspalum notatum var. saurae TaxID=547442 RepID=A0AAQ3UGF0_PASNO
MAYFQRLMQDIDTVTRHVLYDSIEGFKQKKRAGEEAKHQQRCYSAGNGSICKGWSHGWGARGPMSSLIASSTRQNGTEEAPNLDSTSLVKSTHLLGAAAVSHLASPPNQAGMEEPPPPRPRAPPALPDEVVEEILLRSPPDDPARLVRAALVCKLWSRLVSAPGFRRRFRDRHRAAPMLGFLLNDASSCAGEDALSVRFVRTAASCPPVAARRGWHALDAHGGRVLLYRPAAAPAQVRLAVWDPLGRHRDLPAPVLPRAPRSWNAALIGDDDPMQDGPFRVVVVGTDAHGTFACVYSSSGPAAAWSEPAYAWSGLPGDRVDAARGALVGNALHFVLQRRDRLLRYDLGTRDMSVLRLPAASHNQRIALTTTEDGGLGFARMEGYRLCLWRSSGGGGVLEQEWTRGSVVDLRTLLPVIDVLGFAHGLGVVLVGTVDGFFTVDEKSGRISKVGDAPGFYNLVPFVNFHTPAPAPGNRRDDEE